MPASREDQPLLARVDSEPDELPTAEEEDALLTESQSPRQLQQKKTRWSQAALAIWALVASLAVVALSIVIQHERAQLDKHRRDGGGWGEGGNPTGKRNLIFMVSDGMGPASLELARSFRQYTEDLAFDDILTLDKHLVGTSRTRSSSSLVTDSAAGATAFSCGLKSYNGAISVTPDHTPCGTILEAAKKAGYMTGLVVTTRITDATPACFGAHANYRAYEDMIAEHLIGHYPLGRMVDLIIGGGRCHFLPNTTEGSCRADGKDLVKMAKKDGWEYISTREEFDKLDAESGVKLPLLALMADTDIPYEIDRRHVDDQYPAEYEMAELALNALEAATKGSDKGFFILIEGSRIDHAGHGNDPAAQVHEVIAHDKSFATVLDFLENSSTDGILISTSDHETGGLSAARQLGQAYPNYLWYPAVLANATNSASYAGHAWSDYLSGSPMKKDRKSSLKKLLTKHLGIHDASAAELKILLAEEPNPFLPYSYIFADMISRRAEIGWSTHGHSGVDVNIYASSPAHVRKLLGNHENIEIGRFMEEYLDLDLAAVTEELKGLRTSPQPDQGDDDDDDLLSWMGPIPSNEQIFGNEAGHEAKILKEYQQELDRQNVRA